MCGPQVPQSQPAIPLQPPTPVEPQSGGFIRASTIVSAAAAFPIIYYIFKCMLRMFMKSLQPKGDEKSEERAIAVGKSALVTSATTAVGIEAVKELNTRGAVVHMLCRRFERGQEVRRELTELGCDPTRLILKVLDLEDFDAVRKFADDFQKEVDRLDILINNTDLMFRLESDVTTLSGYNQELGLFLLTELMFPLLRKSKQGRIVVVSSKLSDEEYMASREFNQAQSKASYQRTEQANLMYVREIERRLREEDRSCRVLVSACHPQTLYNDVYGSVLKSTSWFKQIKRSLLWFCTKTITDGIQVTLYAVISHAFSKLSRMLFKGVKETKKPYLPDATVSRFLYEERMRAVGLLKTSNKD